jgi:hypothetical protein
MGRKGHVTLPGEPVFPVVLTGSKTWNSLAMLQRFLCSLAFFLIVTPAMATTKVAVFPFDFNDAQQAGQLFPETDENDIRRLKLIADELKSLMRKDPKYEVVDLTAQAKEVEAASPFNKCDACEVPIAKKAGADLAVTGYVDKLSNASISLRLVARDTHTGKLTKTMQALINGNTDDLWLHGVSYLWRNRFNVEAQAK